MKLAVAALCCLLPAAALAEEHPAGHAARAHPDEVLKALLAGNERYASNRLSTCTRSDTVAREKLATGQKPPAIVLSCADSRVPPEIVFDQALGELFVVRVAGNVADPVVIGSIEYAAEHLGASLVMVLGHERCGAVTAAVEAKGKLSPNLGAIVKAIGPSVARARMEAAGKEKAELVDVAITDNVLDVAASLTRQSPELAKMAKAGEIAIVAARYDLDDGKVAVLELPKPSEKKATARK